MPVVVPVAAAAAAATAVAAAAAGSSVAMPVSVGTFRSLLIPGTGDPRPLPAARRRRLRGGSSRHLLDQVQCHLGVNGAVGMNRVARPPCPYSLSFFSMPVVHGTWYMELVTDPVTVHKTSPYDVLFTVDKRLLNLQNVDNTETRLLIYNVTCVLSVLPQFTRFNVLAG